MADAKPNEQAGSSSAPQEQEAAPVDQRAEADKLIAEGKKAIALKQWEEGVAKYADALDIMRTLVGEFDPAMAPLLLSYGKALYELAFSQAGVMGREEVEKQAGGEVEREQGGSGNFVFSADPTSDDEEAGEAAADEGEANAQSGPSEPKESSAVAEEGQGGAEGDEEEVDEPEDDYNAAWEVLDVARTIYSKMVEAKGSEEAREEKLNLAECYLALGDVSCETENFPQAIQDYTSALELKTPLLPSSSRALASVHYQLATVLEFTPDKRQEALQHVETALEGFKARLAEITSLASSSSTDEASTAEGKGKGFAGVSEEVKKLSEKERENEKKECESLIGDLEVKIEELKTAPVAADDFVSESINHLLGQNPFGGPILEGQGSASDSGSGSGSGSGAATSTAPVNDLTSMVKKKPKKVAPVPVSNGTANGSNGVSNEKEAEGVKGEKRSAKESDGAATKKAKLG